MTDDLRRPRFESRCPDCLGLVRWINGRQLKHPCQHNQETKEAAPWKH